MEIFMGKVDYVQLAQKYNITPEECEYVIKTLDFYFTLAFLFVMFALLARLIIEDIDDWKDKKRKKLDKKLL